MYMHEELDSCQLYGILPAGSGPGPGLMWVDRYQPKSTKQIIGQQGEKSCVKKLSRWLRLWYSHHEGGGGGGGGGGRGKGAGQKRGGWTLCTNV